MKNKKKSKAPAKKSAKKTSKMDIPIKELLPKLVEREEPIEPVAMESLEELAEQEAKEDIDEEFEAPDADRY